MKLFETIKSLFSSSNAAEGDRQGQASNIGFVQFFNRSRGYGFIQTKDSDQRVFVHISELKDQVRKGDRVRFDVEPDSKGPKAVNVELLSE
ncbi:MAG: cold shock domain-containing protein [Lewinellaceae bacterium]|nr:cold shock domain-containing protein [Saprospiraceae bacterium]MCB9339073.1 cold shock domain-containing protein [Lewinellaceae bacterium]